MKSLQEFLRCHRVEKGNPCNLTSLAGGLYNIPVAKRDDFFSLWTEAVKEMTQTNHVPLTFRATDKEKQPFLVDVDLKYEIDKKPTHDPKDHLELATFLLDKAPGENFVIVMKPEPYEAVYHKGKEDERKIWKSGAHIYFPDSEVDMDTGLSIRETALEHVLSFYNRDGLINDASDILDDCVTRRKNGLMLVGSYKSQRNTGGQYNVRIVGDDDGYFEYNNWDWLDDVPMKCFYDFALDHERVPKKKKVKHKSKTKKPAVKRHLFKINVENFLKLVGGRPDHEEYKQICMFLAACDIDSEEVGNLCNAAWGETENTSETRDMIDSNRDTTWVGKAWLKAYIRDKQSDLDVDDIVYRKKAKFLNEGKRFQKGVWQIDQIFDFLKDTVCFCEIDGKFVVTYQLQKVDRSGRKFQEEYTSFSQKMPFHGNADFYVSIYPPRDTILGLLKDFESKDVALIAQAAALAESVLDGLRLYNEAKKILGNKLNVEQMLISKLATEAQRQCLIPRYDKIIFRPYGGKIDTQAQPGEYNTFRGFPLETYVPTDRVPFEQTTVKEYLFEVIAGGHEKQFTYVLNVLSMMLKHPERRSHRMYILKSLVQGSGKSSFAGLLRALMSKRYVTFHHSLDRLFSEFNILNAFKLVIFVDDVRSASKAQTRKLFPLVTQPSTIVNQKGLKPLEVEEYSNIILTEMQTSPFGGLRSSRFAFRM